MILLSEYSFLLLVNGPENPRKPRQCWIPGPPTSCKILFDVLAIRMPHEDKCLEKKMKKKKNGESDEQNIKAEVFHIMWKPGYGISQWGCRPIVKLGACQLGSLRNSLCLINTIIVYTSLILYIQKNESVSFNPCEKRLHTPSILIITT